MSGHRGAIFQLTAGPSPNTFLSAAGDGWIVQWDEDDPDPGKLVAKADSQLFSLCQIRDSALLAAGDMNGGIHWIDLDTPDNNKDIAHHKKGTFVLRQIDEHLYSLGGDGIITKWAIPQKRPLESYQLSHQSLRCLAYHAQRQCLAIGSSDHNIYLLDVKSLEIQQVIHNAHENSVFSLAFSPDGQHLFSGSRDAHLKVWDLDHGPECISKQAAHLYTINSIAFHPKGHLFATASRDKHLKIWDASSLQLLKVIEPMRDDGHVNSVNDLYWSSYKNYLISCGDDRMIKIWDVAEGITI